MNDRGGPAGPDLLGQVELVPEVDEQSAIEPAEHRLGESPADQDLVRPGAIDPVAEVPVGLAGVVDHVRNVEDDEACGRAHVPQHIRDPERFDAGRGALFEVDVGPNRELESGGVKDPLGDLEGRRLRAAFVRRQGGLGRASPLGELGLGEASNPSGRLKKSGSLDQTRISDRTCTFDRI